MKRLLYFSMCLLVLLIVLKSMVVEIDQPVSSVGYWLLLLLFSFGEMQIVFLMALLFCLLFLVSRKLYYQKVLLIVYGIISLAVLFLSIVNVFALPIVNGPINYQMIYYSDIFGSTYILDTFFYSEIVREFIIYLSAGLLLLIFAFWAGLKIQAGSRKSELGWGLACLVFFTIYFMYHFPKIGKIQQEDTWAYQRIQSPVQVLVTSYWESSNEASKLVLDMENYTTELPDFRGSLDELNFNLEGSGINNVIVFVLESVSAEYVPGYDSVYHVMPNLSKHMDQALVFSDVYAHNPNTTNSLYAMLGSVYPMISYKNAIVENPYLQWPTISKYFKDQGYHTSFFNTSDNTYSKVNEFLSIRGFDQIMDSNNMPCEDTLFSEAEGVGMGKAEGCMIDAFTTWNREHISSPFFSVLWTIQTHWPYFVFDEEEDYVEKKGLNTFLNALRQSDEALGELLDYLKMSDQDSSTLVVVVGDHGEAFGQHGNNGHGADLYEESVKIPLLFLNPKLFSGQTKKVVGSHIDLIPTVLDVLNMPTEPVWQGESLFHKDRNQLAYFFSTFNEYMIGMRSPDHKAIYNLYQNKLEVYDIQNDPYEIKALKLSKEEEYPFLYFLSTWLNDNKEFYAGY
ncbi:LTA synthase family protein [Litoribacter populi]|uniref:LTA synthase family protein n=1 Tax=Litoribacter populi TaxID=2598460 RepID=UPI00117C4FA5|nr:alkaline phosphatase family protein [Litoribacter populi]